MVAMGVDMSHKSQGLGLLGNKDNLVRKLVFGRTTGIVLHWEPYYKTLGRGSLGSWIDEDRS